MQAKAGAAKAADDAKQAAATNADLHRANRLERDALNDEAQRLLSGEGTGLSVIPPGKRKKTTGAEGGDPLTSGAGEAARASSVKNLWERAVAPLFFNDRGLNLTAIFQTSYKVSGVFHRMRPPNPPCRPAHSHPARGS